MAADFISINTTQRLGSELRQAVNYAWQLQQQLRELRDIMNEQVDGGDYALIESEFGLQAGLGQTVYNLTAGALAACEAGDLQQFMARMG